MTLTFDHLTSKWVWQIELIPRMNMWSQKTNSGWKYFYLMAKVNIYYMVTLTFDHMTSKSA